MKDYINLSDIENVPHEELFNMVSDVINEKNLDYVNNKGNLIVPRKSIYTRYTKRVVDIGLAIIALILTLPINLILAILTFFDVGNPIIFKQKRIGYKCKEFNIVKFRNMTNEKNDEGHLLSPRDRVTQLGKFVRKTSLDELLNFWSILKGDMSFIGPRPLLKEYLPRYSQRHVQRHLVKPGLECPIIKYKNNRGTWEAQFENDIYYVENVSLSLDIKLLFSLIQMVFDPESKKIRGNAIRGSFLGYERDGTCIDSCKVPRKYFIEALSKLGYDIDDKEV